MTVQLPFTRCATTPINISNLSKELATYSDKQFVQKLLHGVQFGFATDILNPPQKTNLNVNIYNLPEQILRLCQKLFASSLTWVHSWKV